MYILEPYNKPFKKKNFRETVLKRTKNKIPLLISFPRSGSHYLRLVMEYYFNRPILPVTFYKHPEYGIKTMNSFLFAHTHDMNLDCQSDKIIYLYRKDLVSTHFSFLYYYDIDPSKDIDILIQNTRNHSKHLNKWLTYQKDGMSKVIITYEDLLGTNRFKKFKEICDLFDYDYSKSKVKDIFFKITKEEVFNRTTHDKNIMKNQKDCDYSTKRGKFKEKYGELILDQIKRHIRFGLYEKYF